ncbi:VOC family protein [Sediminibacillus halophilus]|uniref:Catechol 2,3-dioxygenase n=1 Tax=Sediminibacillus halophilus TaxID=482461 RepID=A0A1G9TRM2_9BACI|nr:VOC family protein [Sediminibacillus halophilus]SDM50406.1 catechol 2,3-dioxygenase [Sediminibacillus halophilus]
MNQDNLQAFQWQEVELTVNNLARSLDFYRYTLGFSILEAKANTAVLGTPDNTVLLRLYADSKAIKPSENMAGLYHFAILVPERRNLAAFLQHIIEKRYPLVGASDHGFSEAIYLQDPDGIGIEVYADRDRSEWKGMDGELPVAADPLKVQNLLHSAEKWHGFPQGTTIGHLHFHVSSISKARQFYVEQLGFSPTIALGTQVLFVAAEGYHHHIGLNTWHGEGAALPEPGMIGLRSVTAHVSQNDFDRLLRQETIGMDGSITDPFGVIYRFQS